MPTKKPDDSITLIMRGTPPNARAFIHLNHGSDCPTDPHSFLPSSLVRALAKNGNIIIRRRYLEENIGANFDNLRRAAFVSALRYIRQQRHNAALLGQESPELSFQNSDDSEE